MASVLVHAALFGFLGLAARPGDPAELRRAGLPSEPAEYLVELLPSEPWAPAAARPASVQAREPAPSWRIASQSPAHREVAAPDLAATLGESEPPPPPAATPAGAGALAAGPPPTPPTPPHLSPSRAAETSAAAPGPDVAATQSAAARRRFLDALRSGIASHQVYPPLARRRGWTGTVLLRLSLTAEGTLAQATVARSSGHSVLDDAALASVRFLRSSAAEPRALPPEGLAVSVPVVFQLER